jgi:hypothetical protein
MRGSRWHNLTLMNDQVLIGRARRKAAGFAAFFAVITVSGVIDAVRNRSVAEGLIVLIACGVPCLLYVREATRRGPLPAR